MRVRGWWRKAGDQKIWANVVKKGCTAKGRDEKFYLTYNNKINKCNGQLHF